MTTQTTSPDTVDPAARGSSAAGGAAAGGAAGLGWRAWSRAALVVAVLAAVVLAFGLHREGKAGDAALGIALAAVAGLAGAMLKARAVRAPVDDPKSPHAAMALQAAILGDFVLMLAVFGAGLLGLGATRAWKFTGLQEFALSFACAAFIFLLVSAWTISQDLASRSGSTPSA
jgi:hypothetical protein